MSDSDATGVVVVFVVFLALVVLACVLAILGCVWAYQAGQGSSRALKAWIVVASIFGLALTSLLAGLAIGGISEFALVPAAVLAAQGALYGLARAGGPRSRR